MSARFNNVTISKDAKLWIKLAIDDALDSKVLIENKRYKATLFSCHAMLEKSIKALLAQQGRLQLKDRHHNISALAEKLTFYDSLKEETKKFLIYASELHEDTSYPESDYLYETLTTPGMVFYCYKKSHEIFKVFLKYYKDYEKSRKNNHE